MTKHLLFVIVGIAAALAACGKKKEAPAAEKAVEPTASGSAAPAAAPAAAAASAIGPIDLGAPTVDLVALFPDAKVVLLLAEEGETVIETREFDTVAVMRGDKTLLEAELEPKTDRITTIRVYDGTIATPNGLDVGKPISALAAKHPDVTCMEEKWGSSCGGDSTRGFAYEIDAEHSSGGAFGEDVPVAKVPAGATIGQVHWYAGETASGPKLAKRPPLADGGDGAPRKPTADEIDRCARVHVAVSACGVVHDHEFGWVKGDKKKVTLADAKQACDVPSTVDEDGMSAFPVPLLEADKVAKLEAAAKQGCKAVKDTLDEVSPGLGPAGYDPSL